MKTQVLVDGLAVQISEIDLKKPMSNDTFAGLHETIDRHAVAIFRDQSLIDGQLVFLQDTSASFKHLYLSTNTVGCIKI